MPTYRRSPAVTWRRLRAGVVIGLPGASEPMQLNGTGGLVWDLLEEPTEGTAVTAQLTATFDQPATVVAKAVDQLLDELVGLGAVLQQ